MTISPCDIVDCVTAGWESGDADDVIAERLSHLGICNDRALDSIELVRSGCSRAVMLSTGMQPHQFASDFEDDPIFIAAIEMARQQLDSQPPSEAKTIAELQRDLSDPDAQVRQTAAYELGQSQDRAAIPLLLNALDDSDDFVRIYTIQSLSRFGATDAIPQFCAILHSDRNGTILTNVVKSLAKMGDRSAVPALIQSSNDPNPFIRLDVARALGELGDRRAIPALESLLTDKTKPIEIDGDGLPVKSSPYRVCDQARMALEQLGHKKRSWWRFW